MRQRRLVVGGIIVDDLSAPTSVLGARRSAPEELRGLWEFPGGKVEEDESARHALARELREELAVSVTVGAELRHPDGAWPISDTHELRLFWVEVSDGVPVAGVAHDELRRLDSATLTSVPWLPADAAAVDAVADVLRGGARNLID
ncbi:NUDIX domain-containing protein [Nocardioides terrisoli]|uniref:NUDIX domain-containing protein n=1 Tax=Nocardioides terrisoli TaxID=3388267 RepID=UPI00287BA192|nr:NUDIX domain-containing protein [Nocardioides marmorisolisilvae]